MLRWRRCETPKSMKVAETKAINSYLTQNMHLIITFDDLPFSFEVACLFVKKKRIKSSQIN